MKVEAKVCFNLNLLGIDTQFVRVKQFEFHLDSQQIQPISHNQH